MNQGEIKDVCCMGVPLTVVAAKKPGHWIVRAIAGFESQGELRLRLERFVGVLDPDVEWSTHRYFLPGYVVYGEGDLARLSLPVGVYLFRHVKGDVYSQSAERLDELR